MTDETTTTILTAQSAAEAQVVAALLRAADIPVYIRGRLLQDEFAISQRMLNLESIGVEVPVERADEAHRLIAQARREGEQTRSDESDGDAAGEFDGGPQGSEGQPK